MGTQISTDIIQSKVSTSVIAVSTFFELPEVQTESNTGMSKSTQWNVTTLALKKNNY